MTVTEYLVRHNPGFADLSEAELRGIADFTLLWSAFENQVCGTRASPATLLAIPGRLALREQLHLAPFAEALAYFRDRYWQNGEVTYHFHRLHPDEDGRRYIPLLRAVVMGGETDTAKVLQGILLIVYRYRNNLFHGSKWDDGIAGQLDNFRHACNVLMAVMDRLSDSG